MNHARFEAFVTKDAESSHYDVDFTVPVDSFYTLEARIEGTDGGFSSFNLMRGGTTLASMFGPFAGATETLSQSGVLVAGQYTIYGDAFGGGGDGGGNGSFGHAEYEFVFTVEPLVNRYCVGAVNGSGTTGMIDAEGSVGISDNDFTLTASGLPPTEPGLFFYGSAQLMLPFGNGFRCVGGQVRRLGPPLFATPSGDMSRPLDFTSPPLVSGAAAINPFSTWNFQCWYRDPIPAMAAGFNTTDAIEVTLCP